MPVWNRAKKEEYFERVEEMLGSYNKVLVVGVSRRRGAEKWKDGCGGRASAGRGHRLSIGLGGRSNDFIQKPTRPHHLTTLPDPTTTT